MMDRNDGQFGLVMGQFSGLFEEFIVAHKLQEKWLEWRLMCVTSVPRWPPNHQPPRPPHRANKTSRRPSLQRGNHRESGALRPSYCSAFNCRVTGDAPEAFALGDEVQAVQSPTRLAIVADGDVNAVGPYLSSSYILD